MPGVKPARSKRAMNVVDWVSGMRAEILDVLRASRSALMSSGENEHVAATVRRITALLERIEGTE
jgi:hypothetical protein